MADKPNVNKREVNQEATAPAESPRGGYPRGMSPYERDRYDMEQRIRRELALKHKFGEVYRSRHDEEVLGILRDPDTPVQTKNLVIYYAHEWGQLFQVYDEIAENEEKIKRAQQEKEPLLEIKYTQYRAILEKNRKLKINKIITDKKILHASKLFPQGVELIPERDYRELGVGKVFAGTDTIMKDLEKKAKQRREKEANEHPKDSVSAEPPILGNRGG